MAVGALPMRFKNLSSESIIKLVGYWQMNHLSPKTIKNKLSVLRALAHAHNITMQIQTNKDLHIKTKHHVSKINHLRSIITPDEIICPPVQPSILLQYHFGLKKNEALRFNRFMIRESMIEIPRSISYNKKDRRIPIVTPEQITLTIQFRNTPENILPLNQKMLRALSNIHNTALKTYHITHPDYFRHLYILNRFTALLSNMPELEALKTVSTESGYYHLTQVREIIKCLKNS